MVVLPAAGWAAGPGEGNPDGGAATVASDPALAEVTVEGRRLDPQRPAVGKTGTKLEDLPNSVQVVTRDLVDEQGGVSVKDAIRNASGIGQGGADGFGFGDRFLVRGLDARLYNDGFSDGDQRNGIPHSLNGVAQVEIMKGPGSALFGSGPPGGTINIVHYLPSGTFDFGGGVQGASFGSVTANAFVTGPTELPGLAYRVDTLVQHGDGFRGLGSDDEEVRPEISWSGGGC
ncbi:MAG: TonB-dependent receptor plug domain-containing protein [Azospirillaceae bacterium]|nr:TonB-dependent receptor plug domain-containing protein [Azospirillaceae bacterium]